MWAWQRNTADQPMKTNIYSNTTVTDTVKVMYTIHPQDTSFAITSLLEAYWLHT